MHVRRPSPAMVVSLVALFLAGSGSALAASRYLITTTAQIKPSVLRGLTTMARGETAEAGSSWVTIKNDTPSAAVANAECPTGDHVISGGYEVDGSPAIIDSSHPSFGKSWIVSFESSRGETRLRAVALCGAGTVGG
jgi:hypothetical protein